MRGREYLETLLVVEATDEIVSHSKRRLALVEHNRSLAPAGEGADTSLVVDYSAFAWRFRVLLEKTDP